MQEIRNKIYVMSGLLLLFGLMIVLHEVGHFSVWCFLNMDLVAYGMLPAFHVTATGFYVTVPFMDARMLWLFLLGGMFFYPIFVPFWGRMSRYQRAILLGFVFYSITEVISGVIFQ